MQYTLYYTLCTNAMHKNTENPAVFFMSFYLCLVEFTGFYGSLPLLLLGVKLTCVSFSQCMLTLGKI